MAVPWPPIHFVAEWMTMSAPCLIGWARSGANVLSTMTGTPRAWATSAIEARSCTSSRGLPISSRKTALVLSSIARPKADGSRAVDEGRRDADLGQGVGEQVVGAAVERRRRDDVVAGAGEVEDRQRLGRLAAGEAEGRDAALERGDALLEDVGRRVHDPGVDVPEFLEPEQPRRVRGVVEDVAGRGVDRDGAGVGRRVGLLAACGERGSRDGRWSDRARSCRWSLRTGFVAGGSRTLAVPAARGGPAVWRTPVVWFGGQTKSRGSDVESAAPGPVSVVPRLQFRMRVTSDPILRTAGPPAHTHVPGRRVWVTDEDGRPRSSIRQPSRPNRNRGADRFGRGRVPESIRPAEDQQFVVAGFGAPELSVAAQQLPDGGPRGRDGERVERLSRPGQNGRGCSSRSHSTR